MYEEEGVFLFGTKSQIYRDRVHVKFADGQGYGKLQRSSTGHEISPPPPPHCNVYLSLIHASIKNVSVSF